MKKCVFTIVCLALFLGLVSPIVSYGYENPPPFRIRTLMVSHEENFHVRVITDNPGQWLCYGGPTYDSWAFINRSADGFKAKYAALLTAFVTGRQVLLTTQGVQINETTRFCEVVEVRVLAD